MEKQGISKLNELLGNEIMPGEGIIKAFFMLFNANLNWLLSGKGEPYFIDLDQTKKDD